MASRGEPAAPGCALPCPWAGRAAPASAPAPAGWVSSHAATLPAGWVSSHAATLPAGWVSSHAATLPAGWVSSHAATLPVARAPARVSIQFGRAPTCRWSTDISVFRRTGVRPALPGDIVDRVLRPHCSAQNRAMLPRCCPWPAASRDAPIFRWSTDMSVSLRKGECCSAPNHAVRLGSEVRVGSGYWRRSLVRSASPSRRRGPRGGGAPERSATGGVPAVCWPPIVL